MALAIELPDISTRTETIYFSIFYTGILTLPCEHKVLFFLELSCPGKKMLNKIHHG